MNVLVLGGTRFLGRHIVNEFSRRGHRVVCFHRGRTTCELPAGAREVFGDRNLDLSGVADERWDAIVDTSGYRPEQLERSLELRTDRYLFVSTTNVYPDLSDPGATEDAPTFVEFDPSDEVQSYGGNKAACERLVMAKHPNGAIVFRPGLIVGAWDPTERFTYWPRRMMRGGRVLAPGSPGRPVQFVDAADLASFAEHLLSHGGAGVFNTVGPAAPATMAQLLNESARTAQERGALASDLVWADDAFLLEHGVEPWVDLPLWLAAPEDRGVLEMSNAKALAAGLRTRSIAETVGSILDWIGTAPPQNAVGLSMEREAELLEKLGV